MEDGFIRKVKLKFDVDIYQYDNKIKFRVSFYQDISKLDFFKHFQKFNQYFSSTFIGGIFDIELPTINELVDFIIVARGLKIPVALNRRELKDEIGGIEECFKIIEKTNGRADLKKSISNRIGGIYKCFDANKYFDEVEKKLSGI